MTEIHSQPLQQLVRQLNNELNNMLEAELLIGHAISKPRAWLYAHSEYQLSDAELERLEQLSSQRKTGVPIAYLLGNREFYGREFVVNQDVLIPRPETELLIDQALLLSLPDHANVLDIGTGSGCIILTLASERPTWRCSAVDISAAALAIARQNQGVLGLTERSIDWLEGSLFEPLRDSNQTFDLIVSNPPYVADNDPHLNQGDLRFEPKIALASGDDGLNIIRGLIKQAPSYLCSGGWLMIEHGFDQSDGVLEMFKQRGFSDVKALEDLAGIRRVGIGCWSVLK